MTEEEWLNCTDPGPMLQFVQGKATLRKLRLFAIVCCRSVEHLLTPPSLTALYLLETCADQSAVSDDQWRAINTAARSGFQACKTPACLNANSPRTPACAAAYAVVRSCAEDATAGAAGACYQSVNAQARTFLPDQHQFRSWWQVGFRERSILVHEIFANPFQPAIPHSSWRTPTVTAIATGIYEEKAFARMPVLGDALEDAGCTSDAILTHCRQPGEHVRGCWVVDLVLGKE